ncbi:L-threonylcarbamoyladenylate synthase [Propionibacteriaceae bacterium Y1700]|uniref:L-threonylcarbamoyladenylate synthase n=1 Tax=Microlunatus sp. Y1700 TaxID=3418487 RepID=UPI003DA72B4D
MTASDSQNNSEPATEAFEPYDAAETDDSIQDPPADVAEVPAGEGGVPAGEGGVPAGEDDATDEEPELEPEPEPTWVKWDGSDLDATAEATQEALEAGECVVIPTDTVYGIGADAYDADAVAKLLAAKGRGRDMPPPVLIADAALVKALAVDLPEAAEALTARHWPGALTVILRATPNLGMDLGDTDQTVAVRVPDHDLAREILRRTGPLAVSSANKSGQPAAVTVEDAIDQLGNSVAVYVDGGTLGGADKAPSTIVDFTQSADGVVLRLGALSLAELQEDAPEITMMEQKAEEVAEEVAAARRRLDHPLPHLTDSQADLAASIRAAAAVDPNADAVVVGSDADADPDAVDEGSENEPTDSEELLIDGEPIAGDAEPTDAEPTDAEPTDTEDDQSVGGQTSQ